MENTTMKTNGPYVTREEHYRQLTSVCMVLLIVAAGGDYARGLIHLLLLLGVLFLLIFFTCKAMEKRGIGDINGNSESGSRGAEGGAGGQAFDLGIRDIMQNVTGNNNS